MSIERIIFDASDEELKAAILKYFHVVNHFTTLIDLVAKKIAESRPAGDLCLAEMMGYEAGEMAGTLELDSALIRRVRELMHDLLRFGWIKQGIDYENRIFPYYSLTDLGSHNKYSHYWPTDELFELVGNSYVISPTVFRKPMAPIERDLVAIMMPFDAAFNPTFVTILTACQACHLRGERVDSKWDHPAIIDDIFSLIYRSSIVVVDFTHKNSNVMYEMGIAHTLGRHVIPITQFTERMPFDTAHLRALKYLATAEGLAELTNGLIEKLKQLKSLR